MPKMPPHRVADFFLSRETISTVGGDAHIAPQMYARWVLRADVGIRPYFFMQICGAASSRR